MKAKILGIVVIGGLTLSMVVTGVAAVSQAVNAESAPPAEENMLLRRSQTEPGEKDNALVHSFKFVCPFH